MVIGRLGLVKCATPGEDSAPSSDQRLQIIYKPHESGDDRGSLPGLHRPARCGNPDFRYIVGNSPGLLKQLESGEDTVTFPDHKYFQTYNLNEWEARVVGPRDDTAPHGVETPTPGAPSLLAGPSHPTKRGQGGSASSSTTMRKHVME